MDEKLKRKEKGKEKQEEVSTTFDVREKEEEEKKHYMFARVETFFLSKVQRVFGRVRAAG